LLFEIVTFILFLCCCMYVFVSHLSGAMRVLCYNILAESYAPPDRVIYCPLWALNWEYRKRRILAELLFYDADILCLQVSHILSLLVYIHTYIHILTHYSHSH
jgi:mRNA deadenylase 3'-5' endonuclease subunit Ccr4